MISSSASSRVARVAKKAGVPAELEPLVASLGRLIAASAAQAMEIWLRLDLTMPQFAALHVIWVTERISGRQLAKELGVTPASVVKVCDRLQERGYIKRVRDTEDRRVWWFQLTKTGQEVFAGLVALNQERMRPKMERLSASDRERLARILNEVAETMEARPS